MVIERYRSSNAFQNTFLSHLTVLDTVIIPQINVFSMFQRKFSRFKYQLSWNSLHRSCSRIFSNLSTEQNLFQFWIRQQILAPIIIIKSKQILKLLLNWNFHLILSHEQSLQIELLIKILIRYVQFNQQSLKQILLKFQTKILVLVFHFKHYQLLLIFIQKNKDWNHWEHISYWSY